MVPIPDAADRQRKEPGVEGQRVRPQRPAGTKLAPSAKPLAPGCAHHGVVVRQVSLWSVTARRRPILAALHIPHAHCRVVPASGTGGDSTLSATWKAWLDRYGDAPPDGSRCIGETHGRDTQSK
jgi:hypothetical protein